MAIPALIAWGDGTTSTASAADGTIASNSSGGFDIKVTHTYLDEGKYLVAVAVTGPGVSEGAASATATVADAALKATGQNITATEGLAFNGALVATFTDANPYANIADFSASIDWGDKATTVGTIAPDAKIPGQFDVFGGHVYTAAGSDSIKVAINDVGGSNASASSTAHVLDGADHGP